MNPNLTAPQQTFTYKDLLLKKLSYAVICSVLSQLFVLQFYVFLSNTNVLHPFEWVMLTFYTLVSWSTWVFIVPFLVIIFAQTLICAKDYVVKLSYCSTRFQKFVRTFSWHNILLLFLHVIVGAILNWLFLSISGKNLITVCKGQRYCLNEATFFLIWSGLWTGFYFFIKVYISEKNLTFPVIHQRKFLQLKANFSTLLYESMSLSIWPSIYFIAFYYLYGYTFQSTFKNLLGLLSDTEETTTLILGLHLWFFTTLYYFNMSLMRFYFNLFLTEPVEFPLVKNQAYNLTLQESLINFDWPIVQNLACLDLYLLAQWAKARRQVFFTLSNPGSHPHNWNSLVDSFLKLVTEYTQLLNRTLESSDNTEKVPPPIVQAPIIQSPDKFRNLRNMALTEFDDGYVKVSKAPKVEFTLFQSISSNVTMKVTSFWNFIKLVTGIQFLFGELPQANIRKCLANGNLIIWSSQGIAEIIVTSLDEDKYGIVQKDLPTIITSLVNLKQSLDQLNKVPALTRKMAGYDDFNYRMKGAVTAAVKRSLFNICRKFENYLKEISLSSNVLQYLHVHIICKS